MEMDDAVGAFSALAQEHRLAVFRLLMRQGPSGLPAGTIAAHVAIPSSTLSHHLAHLERAGLLRSWRVERRIFYAVDVEGTRRLVTSLTEDCCQGHPEICGYDKEEAAVSITIYHNPACGTSRNVLAMIRNSGEEPRIIEYLKTPPSRDQLVDLIARAGITPRELLRRKGTPYNELGLEDPALTDDQLIDAMMMHPVLINRPLVVTPLGVRLCRPSEVVLEILPNPQQGAFTKEDGERVVDAAGRRIR
jgi:arsenate reductase